MQSKTKNGYTHSTGTIEAWEAVVLKYSRPNAEFTSDDVIITHGGVLGLF